MYQAGDTTCGAQGSVPATEAPVLPTLVPAAFASRTQETGCQPGTEVTHVVLPAGVKAITFTFDDSPDKKYSLLYADTFKAAGLEGKATFFEVGQQVKNHPEITKALAARGYAIGNHTMAHPENGDMSANEVLAAQNTIKQETGVTVEYFRAPSLMTSHLLNLILATPSIAECDILTEDSVFIMSDWAGRGFNQQKADAIFESFKQNLHSEIVLLHDGGDSQQNTYLHLADMIKYAQDQGYKIVELKKFLQMGTPSAAR